MNLKIQRQQIKQQLLETQDKYIQRQKEVEELYKSMQQLTGSLAMLDELIKQEKNG